MTEPSSIRATEPEPDRSQPESIDLVAADQARRKRRTILVIAGIVIVGGGAALGVTRYQEAEHKREIASAWSTFSRCLIGPPLEANERPSQRIRNVQLTGTTMTDAERTLPGSDKPWPFSCAP